MTKRKYTIRNKTFSCKVAKKKAQTFKAMRADSAAAMFVKETSKGQPVGKEKIHNVIVTGDSLGGPMTVRVRDSSRRDVVIVKKKNKGR